jgi:uncharacterized protein (DUF488 family)
LDKAANKHLMTRDAQKTRHAAKKKPLRRAKLRIFTIGHSNRPIEELLRMLDAHGVGRVADIRTIPRSRHNPQFNADTLAESLRGAGIDYVPMKELGGLRRSKSDSINTGWKNVSFRGFADYMQTPEFAEGIDSLIKIASEKTTAIMCAEAVPWRCHRSLVADALVARGIEVEHILSATRSQPHAITAFARVHGTEITYPGQANLPLN